MSGSVKLLSTNIEITPTSQKLMSLTIAVAFIDFI